MIKIEIDVFDSKKQKNEAIGQINAIRLKKKCKNCFYVNQIGNFDFKCTKFDSMIPKNALNLEEDDHECGEYIEDDFPM